MSDNIDIIQPGEIIPAVPDSTLLQSPDVEGDSSVKRIIAEALRHGGLKEISCDADAGKRHSRVDWLSEMVWNGITDGIIYFSDGTELKITDSPKTWMELVKFLAAHLDGAVNSNSQFNGVNIFKIYKGIDPDRV